jgi:hypothetical protein
MFPSVLVNGAPAVVGNTPPTVSPEIIASPAESATIPFKPGSVKALAPMKVA